MREIFAPFGAIDLVQIQRDGAGKSQGHAYVTCVCCVCSLSAFALCLLSLLFALCSLCSLSAFALCLCLLDQLCAGAVFLVEQGSRLMTAVLLLATFMQWRCTAIAWKEMCKVRQ